MPEIQTVKDRDTVKLINFLLGKWLNQHLASL